MTGARLVSAVGILPLLPSLPLYTITGSDHSPRGSLAHDIQVVAGFFSVNGWSCPGSTGLCLHPAGVEPSALVLTVSVLLALPVRPASAPVRLRCRVLSRPC